MKKLNEIIIAIIVLLSGVFIGISLGGYLADKQITKRSNDTEAHTPGSPIGDSKPSVRFIIPGNWKVKAFSPDDIIFLSDGIIHNENYKPSYKFYVIFDSEHPLGIHQDNCKTNTKFYIK